MNKIQQFSGFQFQHLVGFAILMCIFFSMQSAQILPSPKHPKEKASEHYHISNRAYKAGKIKRALIHIKKAIRLMPTNEKYLRFAAQIYQASGDFKEALRYFVKLRITIQDSFPERAVQMLNAEGCYALSHDLPKDAILNFEQSLHKMNLHNIVDSLLTSSLQNNWGVAELFDQGFIDPCDTTVVGECHKIHITDVRRAFERFEAAKDFHPMQCNKKALWNYAVTKKILGIPKDTLRKYRGYIPKSFVRQIVVEPQDTICPNEIIEDPMDENEFQVDNTIFEDVLTHPEVLFVLDVSGSMNNPVTKEVTTTRFELMVGIIKDLIEKADSTQKIGLLTIGGDCAGYPYPFIKADTANREKLLSALRSYKAEGGTPLHSTLASTPRYFSKDINEKIIFLASDGLESCRTNQSVCHLASQLCNQGIRMEVFSLLLDERSHFKEYGLYQCLTDACQGRLYGVNDEGKVDEKEEAVSLEYLSLGVTKDDLMKGQFSAVSGD